MPAIECSGSDEEAMSEVDRVKLCQQSGRLSEVVNCIQQILMHETG